MGKSDEKKQFEKQVQIKNRKASHEFEFIEKYIAGIALRGTEIKSIRQMRASLQEAYCAFMKGELYIRKMNISPYFQGSHYNHEPARDRKLLLHKRELRKLHEKVKERGHTIVPVRLFINDRGLVKLEIALAKGKKLHDKREAIKEKDMKREMERSRKNF